jgi:hypothetical protein
MRGDLAACAGGERAVQNGPYYEETLRMAAPLLPQDVTEHLETAIHLFNRHVHLRLLDEAETLLALNLPAAAIAIAGVVLECLPVSQRDDAAPQERHEIEKWSELRDGVVHSQTPGVSLDAAREMVAGVRRYLLRATSVGPRRALRGTSTVELRRVRGKYKFVPTSSAEFIARKADELRLEHDERGH